MSKKDDTIKTLKKKLKKLKAELDALKGPGKKKDKQSKTAATKGEKSPAAKSEPTVLKSAKGKSAKIKLKKKSKKTNPAKTAAPAVKPEPMKIVASEPTPLPPPARIAVG